MKGLMQWHLPRVCACGILLVTLLSSCIHREPIPTDKAMTTHFMENEDAFCELRDSILTLRHGFYYPPFYRDMPEEYKRECEETGKNYIYSPDFLNNFPERRRNMVEGKETERVLDESEYKDTIVYRHITGDWYIELEHS